MMLGGWGTVSLLDSRDRATLWLERALVEKNSSTIFSYSTHITKYSTL